MKPAPSKSLLLSRAESPGFALETGKLYFLQTSGRIKMGLGIWSKPLLFLDYRKTQNKAYNTFAKFLDIKGELQELVGTSKEEITLYYFIKPILGNELEFEVQKQR
jgi:hypothetical protein